MQIRLGKVIDKVNKLDQGHERGSLQQRLETRCRCKGTVAFGSALYNWAVSVPVHEEERDLVQGLCSISAVQAT